MRTSKKMVVGSSGLSNQLETLRKLHAARQKKIRFAYFKAFTFLILLIITFSIGYMLNPNAYQARNPMLVSKIAEEVLPSIVSITNENTSGSGIILSQDGYILTNYHVVDQMGNTTKVLTQGKDIYPARLIGKDSPSDLAVIKIDSSGLQAAKLGDSDNTDVGEEVIAIGTPFGLDSTITTGIISAMHRDRGPTVYRDFLQTDANINPGNSGGPLVNLKGEVVGINTFIISSQVSPGAGFAIPINLAKKVSGELISQGNVSRGYFGIQVTNIIDFEESGKGKIENGAKITGIEENGPADIAGLEVNDTVTIINNIEIENANHLKNIVAWIAPNTTADVEIKRNNETMKFEILASVRPSDLR